MGLQANNAENDSDDWVLDDKEDEPEENEDPCCPKLRLSKEEKGRIRKPWRQTLIIKLLSRSIGYKTLLQIIISLWKPKATISLVTIDKEFFLDNFVAIEDYDFAK